MKISREDRAFKAWVLAETKRFEEDETEPWPRLGKTDRQTDMVEFWKYNRPKMYKNLQELDILKETAFVLICKALEAADKYRAAGMPMSDARITGEQEWLIMDPEEPDEVA